MAEEINYVPKWLESIEALDVPVKSVYVYTPKRRRKGIKRAKNIKTSTKKSRAVETPLYKDENQFRERPKRLLLFGAPTQSEPYFGGSLESTLKKQKIFSESSPSMNLHGNEKGKEKVNDQAFLEMGNMSMNQDFGTIVKNESETEALSNKNDGSKTVSTELLNNQNQETSPTYKPHHKKEDTKVVLIQNKSRLIPSIIIAVIIILAIVFIIVLSVTLSKGSGNDVPKPSNLVWTLFSLSDDGCGQTNGWSWDKRVGYQYDYTIKDSSGKKIASATKTALPNAIIPAAQLGAKYRLELRAVKISSGKRSGALRQTKTVTANSTSKPIISCVTYNKSKDGCDDYVQVGLQNFSTMQGQYFFGLQSVETGDFVSNVHGTIYRNIPLVVDNKYLRYVSYPINSNLLLINDPTVFIIVAGSNVKGRTDKRTLSII